MAGELNRGEIWLLDLPRPDKRRPVLILTRRRLIGLLHTVMVVALTSTLRGAPTEVEPGTTEGLKGLSCANLCNVFTVEQHRLRTLVVCRALTIATGCD